VCVCHGLSKRCVLHGFSKSGVCVTVFELVVWVGAVFRLQSGQRSVGGWDAWQCGEYTIPVPVTVSQYLGSVSPLSRCSGQSCSFTLVPLSLSPLCGPVQCGDQLSCFCGNAASQVASLTQLWLVRGQIWIFQLEHFRAGFLCIKAKAVP